MTDNEKLTGFDLDDQDDFDLDLDGEDTGDYSVDEDVIPKSRVVEIVKKRLAREKGKVDKLYNEFKRVYGMSPEEAIEFGVKEQQRAKQAPAGDLSGSAVQNAVVQAAPGQGAPIADPVLQKIAELDNRWRQMEAARTMEREAAEFVQAFPGVKFEDIPQEVLDRRAAGGLTLAEAYKLYTADQRAQEAAKKAAEATARGIKSREGLRVEGADYTGGSGDDAGSLTEEERNFARMYGMSPKEYVAYKLKLRKMRESEGSSGGVL